MTTVDDVFYLYERNSSYYYNCGKQGKINECPDMWCNECYCISNQDVLPVTIGNQQVPCSFKRKCYIKPGEDCPICFDKILKKSESYLTCCGHSFHKSCLFKCMETKWKKKYASNFTCPVCRANLGTDVQEMSLRYKMPSENNLDNLENFWLNKDLMLTQICSNNYDHDIGMKNNCYICSEYREKGFLLYEINS
jgi:hypothetical protein